jgi:hypothetical protein
MSREEVKSLMQVSGLMGISGGELYKILKDWYINNNTAFRQFMKKIKKLDNYLALKESLALTALHEANYTLLKEYLIINSDFSKDKISILFLSEFIKTLNSKIMQRNSENVRKIQASLSEYIDKITPQFLENNDYETFMMLCMLRRQAENAPLCSNLIERLLGAKPDSFILTKLDLVDFIKAETFVINENHVLDVVYHGDMEAIHKLFKNQDFACKTRLNIYLKAAGLAILDNPATQIPEFTFTYSYPDDLILSTSALDLQSTEMSAVEAALVMWVNANMDDFDIEDFIDAVLNRNQEAMGIVAALFSDELLPTFNERLQTAGFEAIHRETELVPKLPTPPQLSNGAPTDGGPN